MCMCQPSINLDTWLTHTRLRVSILIIHGYLTMGTFSIHHDPNIVCYKHTCCSHYYAAVVCHSQQCIMNSNPRNIKTDM